MVKGRCMKCKKQVEIKDAKEVTMKNGMVAMKGVCPACSTKVFRIMGKKK
jgi:DNA-directed RNA polymerase subunit RPC12/RpoP